MVRANRRSGTMWKWGEGMFRPIGTAGQAKIPMETAQQTMIPKNTIPVNAENARAILRLVDSLEDQDDVQNVYVNCEIPDEVMKEIL